MGSHCTGCDTNDSAMRNTVLPRQEHGGSRRLMGAAVLARSGTQASALASKEHGEGLARAWQLCSDPTRTQGDGEGNSPSAQRDPTGERNKQTNKKKSTEGAETKQKIQVKRGNKSISSRLRFLTWPSTHRDREAKPRANMHHGSAMHYVAAFRIR